MHRNLAHYYGSLRRFTIRDQIEPSSSEDDFVALTSWAKGKDDSLLGPSNPENKTWARRVSDADEDVDLFRSRCISGCKWSSLIAASYTGTVRSWAVTGNIQERMRGCRKSNLFPKNINSLEWLTQCEVDVWQLRSTKADLVWPLASVPFRSDKDKGKANNDGFQASGVALSHFGNKATAVYDQNTVLFLPFEFHSHPSQMLMWVGSAAIPKCH